MNGIKRIIKNYLSNIPFLPAKPLLIGRIINNYRKILVLRRPCLRALTLATSYTCQMGCRHCSVSNLRSEEDLTGELSLSHISKILRDAEACGAINIHFTGGEPLLCKDFFDIVSLVDADRNILSLVTNGLLLAEKSENLKRAKFDLVIVSIDSPSPEIHDEIRRYKGAHKKAWEGIGVAKRAGLNVMVAMVATHNNLNNGEVEEQIRLCREKGIGLQILPARGVGEWHDKKDVLLNSEDRLKFYKVTSQIDVRWDGRSSYLSPRCLAGRERLYIDSAGNVFPCDFIQIPFGNVKHEPLVKIWQRMLNTHPFNRKNSVCISAFDDELVNKIKG